MLGCTAAAMLPKQTRETFRKHFTKLRIKVAVPPSKSITDHARVISFFAQLFSRTYAEYLVQEYSHIKVISPTMPRKLHARFLTLSSRLKKLGSPLRTVPATAGSDKALEWDCPGCNITEETDEGLLTVSNTITFAGSMSFNGSRVITNYVYRETHLLANQFCQFPISPGRTKVYKAHR